MKAVVFERLATRRSLASPRGARTRIGYEPPRCLCFSWARNLLIRTRSYYRCLHKTLRPKTPHAEFSKLILTEGR